jgi:hypothetical protein
MISPLKLFSYWIFAWFLLWMCFSKKTNQLWWSPWLALVLALVENIGSWIWLFLQTAHPAPPSRASTLAKYGLMILLIKVLPLWLTWPTSVITFPWKENALVLLCVLGVYWAVVHYYAHQSPLEIYRQTMTSIAHGTNETPLFYIWSRLIEYIFKNRNADSKESLAGVIKNFGEGL